MEDFQANCEWLASHFASDCNADTVFVEPTPDLSHDDPTTLLRGLEPAERVRTAATLQAAPLAEAFAALWGPGGASAADTLKALDALYTLSADQPFSSRLEGAATGASIPNALGQLRIARSVLAALQPAPPPPLSLDAELRWTAGGVRARLGVKNPSKDQRRAGSLTAWPLPGDSMTGGTPMPYDLAPGETAHFEVGWPTVLSGVDLLHPPASRYLAPGRPVIPLIDTSAGGSRPYAVTGRFEVDTSWDKEGQLIDTNPVVVHLQIGTKAYRRYIDLPEKGDVGRVSLVEPLVGPERNGWAATEVVFVRCAEALPLDAKVDGDLSDWKLGRWLPLGEPAQAQGRFDIEDHRRDPKECYLQWAIRAGRRGVYLAYRGTGDLSRDQFAVRFDPRPIRQLGDPGRYYWVDGAMQPDGKVDLTPGTTSPHGGTPAQGAWRKSPAGLNLELFVPYTLMAETRWPDDDYLGLSLSWQHHGADGAVTQLNWSDDGDPWSPHGFCVAERSEEPNQDPPWLVRLR
jgi:hypothetical protein